MKKRSIIKHPVRLLGGCILLTLLYPTGLIAQTVDATTMKDKVLAGYQGWFRTPGDAHGNLGWAHLFNGRPLPEKLAFDTWPDMSELSAEEKYPVPGFSYGDGKQAYLYSAQNYQTVLRHFRWMKKYKLDGIWLSEFCGHFPGGRAQSDSSAVLTVMRNVQKAARATGRTWAFMWDMSGISTNLTRQQVFDIIVNQWKKMVDGGVTTDNRYLHENGNPVLLIWGFFPNRPASQPDYMNPVIDFLLGPGKYQATLVAGVDPNWRAEGTPAFQAMLMRMQGLQPWSVGRRIRDPKTGYDIQNTTLWEGDIQKCRENNVLFMPVFNSGTHIAGPPPPAGTPQTVPRRMGNYLWEQYIKASHLGLKSGFVAMFDEINEGTQIMKIDLHPPVQANFFTYDGATSDFYLRLTAKGAQLLKNGRPVSPELPVSPFDDKRRYLLKKGGTGNFLKDSSTGFDLTIETTAAEWEIRYDTRGFYLLKNAKSGKYLSQSNGGTLQVKKDQVDAAELRWRLEWDGKGCRMFSYDRKSVWVINDAGIPEMTADITRPFRWEVIPE
ncbi:hypothetical protein SNE25_04355 [Mucilaginibacter sabulilitoris]|uniref:Ricin B lectin domain-containing protein n=1 Tax=Mucilaginibacter sabulilitoris TaxID=1173583 RepID=A0ABZ0TNN5_9SPHI|nr:hypothetical protein [Mucilaginibacter sabulilitoris]WPU94751.1 hypothetical protein SNE25_04355 [Mucilaginibacter sabulilitoris]